MPERLLHPGRRFSPAADLTPGAWHGVPDGFEVYELEAESRLLALKSSSRDVLLESGFHHPRAMRDGPLVVRELTGGRTRHALVRARGEEWVLKAYRRGGVVGRWNSDRYWGSSRFLEELVVAAHAEQSGVATAEVLAMAVERAGFGSVRAWIVTRYLAGARPLSECLGDPNEGAICRAAGQVVRRMHLAGIDHHDLHLGNIMSTFEYGRAHAFIVDWDRARVRADAAWSPYSNLSRLWRSLLKGRNPEDLARTRRPVRAFIGGYFDRDLAGLRQARAYFRRRALWLSLRRLWRGNAR